MNPDDIIAHLKNYDTKKVKIMEVCGTHTSAIVKSGIRDLISPSIQLVSGPGCPVCVTPSSYIDRLVDHSFKENHTVLSFGDMFRVNGSRYSLAQAKAVGASVQLIYSPLEAVSLAKENPQRQYIVAAVGFETTIPVYAVLVDQLVQGNIRNVRLLTSLKTMLPALDYLCQNEEIDAFLCPGHVSVLIGSAAYQQLCDTYQKPFVIAGFEPEHILAAIYQITYQIDHGLARVENYYPSVVSAGGQKAALELGMRYFEPASAFWRGIGAIEGSGMVLKEEFRQLDLDSRGITEDSPEENCRCGDVILGRIQPDQCPLFATVCKPSNPVGACMVSMEGSCGIWYGNRKN